MAKPSASETQKLVQSWFKSYKAYEASREETERLRKEAQRYGRGIYEALGTAVFTVKEAGAGHPGFRAFHKQERQSSKGKTIIEAWDVIPVPQFGPEHNF